MTNILRQPEVVKRTGLSRTTIWRQERAGEFPRRIMITSDSVGWIEAEIEQWIKQRPRGVLAAPAIRLKIK